jgi:hypothetical protein
MCERRGSEVERESRMEEHAKLKDAAAALADRQI